jgi:uncharacterized protein (DUF885 family)
MRFRYTCLSILLLSVSIRILAQSKADKTLELIIRDFETAYEQFSPPALSLDFKVNLSNQLDTDNIAAQKSYFKTLATQLTALDPEKLSDEMQMDFRILQFEADLNIKRLELLSDTNKGGDLNSIDRIYDYPQGPSWYAWFVSKWTGTNLSPEEIMAFGEKEVERVKEAMKSLDLSTPKPAAYTTHDTALIIKTLKAKRDQINAQLAALLPEFTALPPLNIDRGSNRALAQTPGYYSNNTFYFNLFDSPFDLADCDWLLIHEGNPGHHFEVKYSAQLRLKPYRAGLSYLGFAEGWAAYTENLGWDLGLYKNPYEALGKWKWDIIRSVRIVLDVGLNYYGWSDEKAMQYWQQHIQGQDDIATREINRMKRWPAQVLTYKLGEAAILQALKNERERLGTQFNYKNFHTKILGSGRIPVALISQLTKQML